MWIFDGGVINHQSLLGGTMEAGFYGEVRKEDFITYSDLAAAVGLNVGTPTYDDDWLKFSLYGKVTYMPKKPARVNFSWQDLYARGLVYGVDGPGSHPYPANSPVNQRKVISIGNKQYLVRLMTGSGRSDGKTSVSETGQVDPLDAVGSEWNKLMYPIHRIVPNRQVGENWANYEVTDLITGNNMTGSSNPVQESYMNNTSLHLHRGFNDPTYSICRTKGTGNDGRGWRPLLIEL